MIVELPLFQNAELAKLKERREALLRSVQRTPAYTPGRPLRLYKLQLVTAEILKLEAHLRRGER